MDYLLSKEKVKRWPKDMIAAGRCHTVGLKSDGTVVAVGRNKEGNVMQVAGEILKQSQWGMINITSVM